MNIIKHTDSYKLSHFKQYPSDVKYVSSYIEARNAAKANFPTEEVVFFGLQAFIKKYLMDNNGTTFYPRDASLMAHVARLHGEPFNQEGWEYLFSEYEGRLPVLIEAIDEGSVVPLGTPLVQIRNTDPKVPWLTSYLETALLRAIWYPTTVATLSYSCKKMMKGFWDESVDEANLGGLDFALHDFGARGVSSCESAELGGMGHLLSFNGTDTVEALYAADHFYPELHFDEQERKVQPFEADYVAGYSVPAAEHSTITSWGRENEDAAITNMVEQFGGDGKIYSVVSDSYDIYDCVRRISSGSLFDLVRAKGGRFVIRPDSGDPATVIENILNILEANLPAGEITTNSKGFKVLPPYFRILQGDGVEYWSIQGILDVVTSEGWSAENLVFGMGGALLQKVNRDTLSFAMKCNAVADYGEWRPIYKRPTTDPTKSSKAGRIETGLYARYENGLSYGTQTFSNLKARVQKNLLLSAKN